MKTAVLRFSGGARRREPAGLRAPLRWLTVVRRMRHLVALRLERHCESPAPPCAGAAGVLVCSPPSAGWELSGAKPYEY